MEVDGEAVQELVRSLVEAPPSQSSEVAFVSEGGDILSELSVHQQFPRVGTSDRRGRLRGFKILAEFKIVTDRP